MLNEDELNELDALLLTHTDEDGMLLSEFDGFCAGLVVCPDMIMPGEWMPCVWGRDTESSGRSENLRHVADMLVRHYNDVAHSLMPPAHAYGPLFDQDTRTGEILWEPWCSGFERAMRLRPDAWKQIVEGNQVEVSDVSTHRTDLGV